MDFQINEKGNVAHYSTLNNLANILYDKQIKFSSIENLDDPRENSLSWVLTTGLGTDKVKSDIGSQLKIFCTASEFERSEHSDIIETSIYGRPRMWSQYGDNSKGFCIILNKEILNDEISKQLTNPKHILKGVVEYPEWLSIIENSSVAIEGGESGMGLKHFDTFAAINKNEALSDIFFKKSKDFSGEKEYRWLLFIENKREIFVPIEKAIEAVVLGVEFPNNQYSQVRVYCNELRCPCYRLEYDFPRYKVECIT